MLNSFARVFVSPRLRSWLAPALLVCALLAPRATLAEAMLVVDADSGKVLHAENATYPWYQASVTKLMTTYVTLRAVKEGRITLDTLLTVSPNAVAQEPSKMGFPAGTQVTVDNALKMMMVKSANDMAVVLAEGVSGSIDKFSDEMNRNAQRLGMVQTNYVNPNGLPADGQVTSARDLAMLARAILRDLPEYEYFVHIPAIKFGRRVTRNFNSLLGRYPGADGMKTGFICASGFNLVASATRNGRRLIAVVLGAPSSAVRTAKAAALLERGFSDSPISWLTPSLGTVENLVPINAAPPNLREDTCGAKRKRPAASLSDDDFAGAESGDSSAVSMFTAGLRPTGKPLSEILMDAGPVIPVVVYTGPKKSAAELAVAAAQPVATPRAKRPATNAKASAKTTAAANPKATPAPRIAAVPAKKNDSAKAATPAKPKADVPAVAKQTTAKSSSAPKADATKSAAPKAVAPKPAAATSSAAPKAAPKAGNAAPAKQTAQSKT